MTHEPHNGLPAHILIINESGSRFRYWPYDWNNSKPAPEWVTKDELPKQLQVALMAIDLTDGQSAGAHSKRITDNEYHFSDELFASVDDAKRETHEPPSDIGNNPDWGSW